MTAIYLVESNPPVRGVLMTPGQGGSCYEDLGDLTDIMPTGDLKDQCSRDIYKDVIKTELLMEGRTFKESCSIYVYREYQDEDELTDGLLSGLPSKIKTNLNQRDWRNITLVLISLFSRFSLHMFSVSFFLK